MNYFTAQRKYLQDNPQGLWFKRKLYGWGWTPAKWQGWAVIGVYIALVLIVSFSIGETFTTKEMVIERVLPVVLLTAILIRLCYVKGEKPMWQWGIKK